MTSRRFLIDRRSFLQVSAVAAGGAALYNWHPLFEDVFASMRVAIIGLGDRGRHHAALLKQSRNLIVTALCDVNRRTLGDVNSLFPDALPFESADELLASRQRFDALLVTVPDPAGIHLLDKTLQLQIPAYVHPAGAISSELLSRCNGSTQVHVASRGDASINNALARGKSWPKPAQEIRLVLPANNGLDRELFSGLDAVLRAAPLPELWESIVISPFPHSRGHDYAISVYGADFSCDISVSAGSIASPRGQLQLRTEKRKIQIDLPRAADTVSAGNLWRNFHASVAMKRQTLLASPAGTLKFTSLILGLMAESRYIRGPIEVQFSEASRAKPIGKVIRTSV
jgi:hypothetical protein